MKNLKLILSGALLSAAVLAPSISYAHNWSNICFTNKNHLKAVKVVPQTTSFQPVVLVPGYKMSTTFYHVPAGTIFRVYSLGGGNDYSLNSSDWKYAGSGAATLVKVGNKVKPYYGGSTMDPALDRVVTMSFNKCRF